MISDMIESSTADRPVALVTGGGTGIGAATAGELRRSGWDVVICGRRPEPLREVADGCGAVAVTADITSGADRARLIGGVVDAHGRLDGLVLNAGIQRMGTLETLSEPDFDAVFATNVRGPLLLAKLALPHLLAARGALVSVGSVAALRAAGGMTGYGASKAALTSLTQSIGVDFGPRGLRANVVCPGWTRTELADAEMTEVGGPRGLGVDDAYRFVTSLVPLRRPARGAEVGAVIAWLLSPQASYINAAVIPVDGGHVAMDPGTVPFDPRVHIDTGPIA